MENNYILKGRAVHIVPDFEWAEWLKDARKRYIIVSRLRGGVRVSTVFLPVDHQFEPGLPPILFETMVFGGRFDGYMWRYYTYAQSVTGHHRVVKLVCFTKKLKLSAWVRKTKMKSLSR